MKIAIINNLYKPYQKGGAEKVAEITVNQLQSLGHQVFLVTTKPKNKKEENTSPKTYYINSKYYNLKDYSYTYRLLWQIDNVFNIKKSLKLKKILKKEKPDLVISNNLMGLSFLSFFIIRQLKIKHVHILHDIQLIHPSGLIFYHQENIANTLAAKIFQLLNKKISSSPDLIVSPSKWLLEKHLRRDFFKKSKKLVLDNPLAFKKSEIKKEVIENKKDYNFIFVGQIEEHKGIIFLIKTFNKIKDRQNIKLTIVGDGTLMNQAQKLAKDNKNISFLGKKSGNEVRGELLKHDCLIVPSLCYENSPTVIYEASAFNLPVIASDLGGISELIKKYKGILFEAKNSHDLINKIDYFCNNFSKYIGAELPQIGEEKYAERILGEIKKAT
jgi:glycosyltransferase involved in cell wall biosynthesis